MAFGGDRTVRVGLKLDVGNYVAQIGQAGKATQDFGKSAIGNAEKHKQSWQELGTTMGVVGAAIGVGVGLAVKAYADFDQEMSNVRAVSGATASEMRQLTDAAIAAGAGTKFSAREAAQATGELAKAGVSTADILGGALTGSLNLAAAGNLDLAYAAEVSGQAMNLFKLQGKDVPAIADALANGANKSAADVQDLAQALSQGGLVAAQTGLTLNDTVGVLSAFADRALKGSDAGTSLKTMLQRLNPQSEEAANLMDELGLRAYDASGQFIGMEAYAQRLQDALGGMSTEQRNAAMQTLFGADAVRAANVLYDLGAEGVHEYVSAIGEQGSAARVAAIQMDNLKGDIEQLGGAFETVLIQGGKGANDELRSMVQTLTSVIEAYGSLPKPIQEGVVVLAALTAGTLLLGGAFLTVVPKIAATKAALIELTGSATAARTAMTGLVGALGVVAAAFAAVEVAKWSAQFATTSVSADKLAASLQGIGDGSKAAGEFGKVFQGWGARGEIESTAEAMDKFAASAREAFGQNTAEKIDRFTGFGSDVAEFSKQVEQLDGALAAMVEGGNIDGATAAYEKLMAAIDEANKQGANIDVDAVRAKFVQYQEALDGTSDAAQAVGSSMGGLSAELAAGGETAEEARKAVDDLIQSLASAGLVQLSARDAARQWEQALDDLTASVAKNGQTLDITTQAGRDNQSALDDVAKAAINQAQAIYNATGQEEKFRASLLQSRGSLVQSAIQFGMTQAQAEAYADEVLNIPAVKSTSFTTPGLPEAKSNVASYRRELIDLPNGHTFTLTTRFITSGAPPANAQRAGIAIGSADGNILQFANGGTLPAIGAQQPQIQGNRGPAGIMWAETGAGPWEAFISGHPGKRARSLAIWEEVGSRLGVRAFASGGFIGGEQTTTGPTVNVNVSADAPTAFGYAQEAARAAELKLRDAINVHGLSGLVG